MPKITSSTETFALSSSATGGVGGLVVVLAVGVVVGAVVLVLVIEGCGGCGNWRLGVG